MTNSTFKDRAEDYLRLRRSVGYRLGGHDRPLADFVAYLDRAGLDTVTVESVLAWATLPETTPLRHSQRLSSARGFATYLHALDPRNEVSPRALLPEGRRLGRRASADHRDEVRQVEGAGTASDNHGGTQEL
jgi:hypothetical protein